MSNQGNRPAVPPEEYVEAVAELHARGDCKPHGGVSVDAVAEHVGVASSTASRWLNRLVNDDQLVQTWGLFENGPRQTYEPVGVDDE